MWLATPNASRPVAAKPNDAMPHDIVRNYTRITLSAKPLATTNGQAEQTGVTRFAVLAQSNASLGFRITTVIVACQLRPPPASATCAGASCAVEL